MSEAFTHTGRELQLMLEGRKPLAMFYAGTDELPWEELIPEHAFAPHVANVTRRDGRSNHHSCRRAYSCEVRLLRAPRARVAHATHECHGAGA